MRALILGGTREARDLAPLLIDAGFSVTSSLAGRVKDPALPDGEVRIGGFGGPVGLAEWIVRNDVRVIIDATHPFAERISASADQASRSTGVPLIALHRPEWTRSSGDVWTSVSTMEQAATMCGEMGNRILMTIGRQNLHHFTATDGFFLIRCVEKPSGPLPKHHEVLLSRGPFTVEGEKELMRTHGIDLLVTKNSGGALTAAKLKAARELGIPVLMIERPELPAAASVVHTPAQALHEVLSSHDLQGSQ